MIPMILVLQEDSPQEKDPEAESRETVWNQSWGKTNRESE